MLKGSMRAIRAKIGTVSLWHFVWMSIALSVLLTAMMSLILKGAVESDYLLTGAVVSLIVASVVIFFVKELRGTHESLLGELALRRQAEQVLRESEERFHSLFNHAADCIFLLDTEGRIVDANEAACSVHGYGLVELIGKHITSLDDPETAKLAPERLDRLMNGEHITFEGVHLRKDGSKFPIEASVRLIYLGGKPFIQAIDRDITERKKMMDMLIRSMQDWEDSFNTITDMITVHDGDFNIIRANKAAEKILGLPFLGDLKSKCYKFYHGTDSPPGGCPSCRCLTTGVPSAVEMFEPHLKMFIEIRAIPRFNSDNELVGLIHVVRDITGRKQTEKMIEASLREKEVLLKEIHHRVKNNLQVISSLLNLQAGYVREGRTLDIFMESQNRIKSMALIHEKLYQSGDLARVDFSEYIRSLAANLFSSYGVDPERVALKINAGDIMFSVDTAIPCGLIINELVSNSLKHAFPEGRRGGIAIDVVREGTDFCFTVKDSGVGIPGSLDFRNTESLGLQLVVTLADQLDGSVELDRSGGTLFRVKFAEPKYKGGSV